MAKPATERDARRDSKDSKAKATGPLAKASEAISRGDIRTARIELASLSSDAPADDRALAQGLLDGLGLDLAALATAGAVLAVIALAAILALFSRHG